MITSDIRSPFVVVEGHDIADVQVLPTRRSVTKLANGSIESETLAQKVENPSIRQPLASMSSINALKHETFRQITSKTKQEPRFKTQEPRRKQSKHEDEETPTKKISKTPPTPTPSSALVDPAILSIRKADGNGLTEKHYTLLSQAEPLVSATLSKPFHSLSLSEVPLDQQTENGDGNGEVLPRENQKSLQNGLRDKEETKKRRRRKRKRPETRGRLISPQRSSLIPISTDAVQPNGRRHSIHLKGTMQALGGTSNDGDDAQPLREHLTVKARQKGRPARDQREISEWEVEDAFNIHMMPDFDFAANLSKFDKRSVFSQFKNDDNTADEARLVGHNRIPRPGTNGGRNLHFSQNVLDTPHLTSNLEKWSSEAGESELQATLESTYGTHVRRPPSSSKRSHDQPRSAKSTRSVKSSRVSRSLSSTRNQSNQTVTLTPLRFVEIEALAVSEMGLSEDILTENAARGIAEVVMHDLKSRDTVVRQPQVIIFSGNHKTGARAISAGRHLMNHGIRVVMAILDANDGLHGHGNETLLPAVRQAIFSFRKSGGKVSPAQTLFRALDSPTLKPHVFLDAVQGIHLQISDLSPIAQANVTDLLELFQDSRREEHVLSLDVPLGRDPITGKASNPNGNSSLQWPQHVIFLGMPKSWRDVLLGMAEDEMEKMKMVQACKPWVVDLGFNFTKVDRGLAVREAGWGKRWVEGLHARGVFEMSS